MRPSGVVFVAAAFLFVVSYALGFGGWAFIGLIAMLVSGAVLLFRWMRYTRQRSLWSVRNRLLTVYGLFGVLPVLLLFTLFAIIGWALVSELASYLAASALDRHIEAIAGLVPSVRDIPPEFRKYAIPEMEKLSQSLYPGLAIYVRDKTGTQSYPAGAPPLHISPDWKHATGLLVMDDRFFAWTHYRDDKEEITVMAPLSDQVIGNLVPHLGMIALSEKEFGVVPEVGAIPAAANKLDFTVMFESAVPHYHASSPGKVHNAYLYVYSRPSAVVRALFSSSDKFREAFLDLLIGIAALFLLVEAGAVYLGVSLSRRITGSVNQIYLGTQRVIQGDFSHRIPVASQDQLGELATSFNQMTGNLQRLLVIEKERERLQTEIEIAREVQRELYPKQEPPVCGLQLTARCDPARMVSGDYYDYQRLDGDKLMFAIGDVAGKGISAALLMATMQSALHAQITGPQPQVPNECSAMAEIDVARLVSKLNQQIYAHTSPEKYATFFFAVYDDSVRTLTYSNAGHLSPLLFRGDEVIPLDTNGIVVGAFPFAQYTESCINFQPGDVLVCYTDGVTEPENSYGEMFGEERLIELTKRHLHGSDEEIIRVVFDAVRSWTGEPELFDDMTLLVARHVGS